MAKWDLSKLPEGRKPLDDAWFTERAQMQERLNMLEAELAEYKHVASAIDNQWAESQDEIADLKAKLAKALAEMRNVDAYLTKLQAPGTEPLNSVNAATSKANRNIYTAMVRNEAREAWALLGNTIAELTGGKDE